MTSTPPHLTGIENLSYEQARDELVQVVQRLESGGVNLQTSLELWERGEALANRCEQWLTGAKARLENARLAQSSQQAAQHDSTASTGSF